MKTLKEYTSEIDSFLDLLELDEALSPAQTKLANDWAKNNAPSATIDGVHDPVFGGHDVDRVTIPLEKAPRDHSLNPVHNAITKHFDAHGIKMADYDKGTVTDKHGRETTVGKALGKTKADPSLMQQFNNDPVRQSTHKHDTGKSITISRHPIDVAGMSTGRKWDASSCMRIGTDGTTTENTGTNRHYIKADMNHGTLAAYVHDNEDTNLENPNSRVLLKRHDSVDRGEKPIFRPEATTYGNNNPDIHHTLKKWAKENYPEKEDGVYVKNSALYNDDRKTIHTSIDQKKFNPKLLKHHVEAAADLGDQQNSHEHQNEGYHGHIVGALNSYRNNLGSDEKDEMDKHLHIKLAKRFHENEGAYNPRWRSADDSYENTKDNRDAAVLSHTDGSISIPKQHVDEIAKAFVDAHAESHGNHNKAENEYSELANAVLSHGSDKSKADLVNNHRTYGYNKLEDTNFDPMRHIVGHHSASAFMQHHKDDEHHNEYHEYNKDDAVHHNMAKHADDNTFHDWLHSGSVMHTDSSLEAMHDAASSKERKEKIKDFITHGLDKQTENALNSGNDRKITHTAENAKLTDEQFDKLKDGRNSELSHNYNLSKKQLHQVIEGASSNELNRISGNRTLNAEDLHKMINNPNVANNAHVLKNILAHGYSNASHDDAALEKMLEVKNNREKSDHLRNFTHNRYFSKKNVDAIMERGGDAIPNDVFHSPHLSEKHINDVLDKNDAYKVEQVSANPNLTKEQKNRIIDSGHPHMVMHNGDSDDIHRMIDKGNFNNTHHGAWLEALHDNPNFDDTHKHKIIENKNIDLSNVGTAIRRISGTQEMRNKLIDNGHAHVLLGNSHNKPQTEEDLHRMIDKGVFDENSTRLRNDDSVDDSHYDKILARDIKNPSALLHRHISKKHLMQIADHPNTTSDGAWDVRRHAANRNDMTDEENSRLENIHNKLLEKESK